MRRLAWQGAALFAFIPLVLYLYLQLPLGPSLSLAAGAGIMLSHRFVAAPWMDRHGRERCLWCGRSLQSGEPIEIAAGGIRHALAVCGPAHRDLTGRFFTFVARFRLPIAAGIFLPLLLLLAGTLALAVGHPFIQREWNNLQFRMVVAFTVAGTSLAYLMVRRPAQPLGCPFPLHNLFLLGVRNTLWVFRIVGAWWLAAGIRTLASMTF